MTQNRKEPNPAEHRTVRTPSETARRTFFYLLECGTQSAGSGFSVPQHDVPSFLAASVRSGKGILQYQGRQFPAEAGDCLFLDCREPFSLRSDAGQSVLLSWVCFGGATSAEYYSLFAEQMPPVFRPSACASIDIRIGELIRLNTDSLADTEILTSGMLAALLTAMLTANSVSDESESALRAKLKTVYDYLETHYAADIRLDDLAERFRISKYYLTREFKRTYGESVFQHILSLRINYAKRLLRFTDKPVEEIAALCGFNDQSYFSRQFKKAENTTCLAFRRRWRE